MKYQLLIVLVLIALVLVNCSKSKSKSKSKAKAKVRAKSKKFLAHESSKAGNLITSLSQILAKEKKGDDVVNVVPATTQIQDDQPIVIVEHDPNSVYVSTHNEMEYEEPCKIKQGYVAMVTSSELRANAGQVEGKEHAVIQAKSVFAVLNQKTIAIFENENVDALLKTVDIHELAPPVIPEAWKNDKIHCFELHHLAKDANLDQQFAGGSEMPATQMAQKRVLGLCFDTEEQMAKWTHAITNFHKCYVRDNSNTVVTDEQVGVNVKTIRKEFQMKEKNAEELLALNQEKQDEYKDMEAEQDRLEREEIEKELAEIRKTYADEKAREKQLERTQQEKVDQVEAQTKELEEKEQCIRDALQTRADEEMLQTESEIRTEENTKQKKSLEDEKDKIKKLGDATAEQINQKTQDEIEDELKQQNKLKDLMVEQTMEFEKDMDPMMCVADNLKTDTDNAIRKACGHTVEPGQAANIQELQKCLNKERFCSYCCGYFIGSAHETKKYACTDECNKLVFPDGMGANVVGDDAFIIRVPVKDQVENKPAESSTPTVSQTTETSSPPVQQQQEVATQEEAENMRFRGNKRQHQNK